MVVSTRILLILAMVIATAVLMVGSAFAQTESGNTRPGWGYGDPHHVHTGPPGLSVRPSRIITQGNTAYVANDVRLSSTTGNNNVRTSSGAQVRTGAVSYVLNLITSLGQNILHFGR